jgi:hypothetical protein
MRWLLTGAGARGAIARNAANLRIGSGMQQARDFRAEKAVEVVRNHGDGTCSEVVPTSRRAATLVRVDARKRVDGKAM